MTRIFKRISKEADPDPRFVRALELKIREEIFPARGRFIRWKAVAISLTSLSMMAVGAGTYAYSSDAVVPGHTLYPVREKMENFRVRMTRGDVARTMAHMEQLKRRLHEQRILERTRMEMPSQHLDRFVNTLDAVIEESNHFSPDVRRDIDQRIIEIEKSFSEDAQNQLRDRQMRMRRRFEQMPPERRERLRELYEERLSNPEPIR